MKQCFNIASAVSVIVLAATTVFANYQTGMEAYQVHHYKWAIKEFKADQSPESNYNLGVMYFKGEGVKADHLVGIEWFRKSAELGLAQAQYVLATIYYGGNYVAQDRVAAAKWYRKAAEQGHLQSQFFLALMYLNGEGVEKNCNTAVLWLKQVAHRGHRDAAIILEAMGEEVPPQAPPARNIIIKMPLTLGAPSVLPPGRPQ